MNNLVKMDVLFFCKLGGKAMNLIKQEWKALFKNKKVLIAVIGVLFVPLMYSGGYLGAFWDPYGKLEELPVAVVNNDKGATFEGEKLEVGKELVDNLKEDPKFNWKFVTSKEAEKGLENQDYYMMIEIPENFSEHATTLQDDNPKKLEMTFKTNKGYNFISGQIGESAIEKIKEEVSTSITKTYAETIFDNIELMADGINEASDGAAKINDGSTDLKEGAAKLDESLQGLVSKSVTFKQGLQDASSGTGELTNGINSLDSGLAALKEGQSELYNGSVQAENGTSQLVNGLDQSLNGLKQLQTSLPQLTSGTELLKNSSPQIVEGTKALADGSKAASDGAANLSENLAKVTGNVNELVTELQALPLPDDKKQQLVVLVESLNAINQGGQELSTNLEQLEAGAKSLNDNVGDLPVKSEQLYNGVSAVESAVNQLSTGQERLYNGAVQLKEGQAKLTSGLDLFGDKLLEAKSGTEQLKGGGAELLNGINQLADGSVALEEGSVQLANGASQLDDGVNTLSEGTNELATKLSDATKETKDAKGSEEKYDMISKPVQLKTVELNDVPNYGTGLAPYFLSLALFVGALLLTVIFPLREKAGIPKSGFSWFVSKFSVLLFVSIIQAMLADMILLYALGIEVKSIPIFMLFSILTSLTFMMIVQFLVTTMDNPGRFIAIIIMILQLTTSAGTFPLELIPEGYQKINQWLPMTYSVRGFKTIISTGNFSTLWPQVFVLVSFIICAMIGTIIYFTIKLKKEKALLTDSEVITQ